MREFAIALFVVTLALAGCDTGGGPEDNPAVDSAPADTVFDPLIDTLDRADSVNDLATGRTDDLNQRLEDSE